MKRDREVLSDLVARSVTYKASVVSKDEKETGTGGFLISAILSVMQ